MLFLVVFSTIWTPKTDFWKNINWPIPDNFSPNIDICMVPPEEPVGGDVDYDDISVKVNMAVVSEELPSWFIVPPITCPYYTQNYYSNHKAVDLINRNCSDNDWIVTVDEGVVSFAGLSGAYGNRIEIIHDNGFVSTYSHLSKIEVVVGEKINIGQKIGIMGSTGRSTGRHLHFEIIYEGIKINPKIYL